MIAVSWDYIPPPPVIPTPTPTVSGETEAALGEGPFDFEIDPVTLDRVLRDDDFAFVSGIRAIKQEIEIRLRTFAGEWFLDTTAGMPWLSLPKPADLDEVRASVRGELLAVEGVQSVDALHASYEAATRRLRVEWTITASLGDLRGEMTVS